MIRLHHCHQSRSMRVLWMLHELELDFEVVIHSFDASLRTPNYLAIHPGGRVPALEIDGAVLFESLGALQYLAARFPEAALGRRLDDCDWLNWLNFAETISQHVAALTQQHVVIYTDSMRSPTVTKLEVLRLGKLYAALEVRLQGRDNLLDGRFSAADIGVTQALYMAQHFAKMDAFPALSAYYKRQTARPAFIASMPVEGADLLYKQDFYEVLNG